MKKLLGVILALFMAVGLVAANVGTTEVNAATAISGTFTVIVKDGKSHEYTVKDVELTDVLADLDKNQLMATENATVLKAVGLSRTQNLTNNSKTDSLKEQADGTYKGQISLEVTDTVYKLVQHFVDKDGNTLAYTGEGKDTITTLKYLDEAVGALANETKAYTGTGSWYVESTPSTFKNEVTSATKYTESTAPYIASGSPEAVADVYTVGTLRKYDVTFSANGGMFKENLDGLTYNDSAVTVTKSTTYQNTVHATDFTVKVPYGTAVSTLFTEVSNNGGKDGQGNAASILVFTDVKGYIVYGSNANIAGFAKKADAAAKDVIATKSGTAFTSSSTDVIEGDAAYYAIWNDAAETIYDVVYASNEKTLLTGVTKTADDSEYVVINKKDVKESASFAAAQTPYKADGYEFKGWAVEEDGEVVYKAGDTVKVADVAKYAMKAKDYNADYESDDAMTNTHTNKVIVLYAVWEGKDYTITYLPGTADSVDEKVTMGELYTTKGSEYNTTTTRLAGWIARRKKDVDKMTKLYGVELDDVVALINKMNNFVLENAEDGSSTTKVLSLTSDEYALYQLMNMDETTLKAFLEWRETRTTDASRKVQTLSYAITDLAEYYAQHPASKSDYTVDGGERSVTYSDVVSLFSTISGQYLVAGAPYQFDFAADMYYIGVYQSVKEIYVEYVSDGETKKIVKATVLDDSKAPTVEKEGYTLAGWEYDGIKEYSYGTKVIDGEVVEWTYVKEANWVKAGTSEPADMKTVYRLYNSNTGEHLFTVDANEVTVLTGLGWTDEGIAWYAPLEGTPVYRLYNPNVEGGEHHYTTNTAEVAALVKLGWVKDDVSFNSATQADGVAVYRLYNSNAYSNNHHFTTDKLENDTLIGLGWTGEEVGFYAAKAAE